MDFNSYIENAKKCNGFNVSGITKRDYLDVIEKCVKAYSKEEIEKRLPESEEGFVDDLQAYSRLACGIGVLLADGRLEGYRQLWEKMMDSCCRDFYRRTPPNTLDFAVKEIMLAYKAMKPFVSRQKLQYWKGLLSKIDPQKCYTAVFGFKPRELVTNWNVYSMAGEYLRETEGMTDTEEYFDIYWPHQFTLFDENGMYMDPHNPMLYDLTTRCQAQLITGFGYRGRHFEQLDACLEKAGMFTLFMQSSAFEFPFGGRSNQYLFNEMLVASNCEYEAVRYRDRGDLKTAGMFKRAAHLALVSIKRWLEAQDYPRHIKNFYPVESKYGTENYGYYDKYMMTMGCFLYIGYIFADDSIEEFPCPAELGGYVLQTSDKFHKVFANCEGNSIELEMNADYAYDSTGMGRYHKCGCPTELALSKSITATHRYTLREGLTDKNISICPGWLNQEGKVRYLCEFSERLEYNVKTLNVSKSRVSFEVSYTGDAFEGCSGVVEKYSIDRNGVFIESSIVEPCEKKIYFLIPAFYTNGKDIGEAAYTEHLITVKSMGFCYRVETDGEIQMEKGLYGNRNGEYRLFTAKRDTNKICIRINIE